MRTHTLPLIALSTLILSGAPLAAGGEDPLSRGEYLTRIAGCNDCHTPGYPESGGAVPKDQWLTGNPVGFQGPWGTTYPTNLRLYVQTLSEAEWLEQVRRPMRPPMPWFALRDMSEQDLVALYRFLRELGPAGVPAPQAGAPSDPVATAFIEFVPKTAAR